MNQTQLEYFVSVAEYGSFTKAARKHFVSQTAVTQQIQNLEEQLHISLFDRKKRPVQLTGEGEAFLSDAKAILERMYGAVSKLSLVSVSAGGLLRIGYTKGYEYSRLSKALRLFHREHPNVFLSCMRGNSTQMAQALWEGDLDVIFTWDQDEILSHPDISWRKAEDSTLDVVLYHSHPFACRSTLTRKDLKEEKFLYLAPSGSLQNDGYLEHYREAGYEPEVLFCTDEIDSILMMIAAEEGISVIPSYVTQRLHDRDGIICIPLKGEKERASIMAVWKTEDSKELLREFLTNYIFCPE